MKKTKKVFIIAEAGVNHNGRMDLALKLINVAADAGADAVKFQTFRAEQVVTGKGKMAAYQIKNLGREMSQLDMIRTFELPERFYKRLLSECNKRHILFLSTPHGGRESVNFLESIGIPIYKISSGDLTNYLLLARVATTKKPIILSTGTAMIREIKDALRFLKRQKSGQVSVLHCTTNYPCPPEEVNLRAIVTMLHELRVPVGYSDHTLGNQTAIMAVTLGAAIYECHFTLDKSLPGPDHRASATPTELKERIDSIRKVEVILGNDIKKPSASESKTTIVNVRRSIVAAFDLSEHHRIREFDLEAKRPGNGISPVRYKEIIGKTLRARVRKDHQFKWSDFI